MNSVDLVGNISTDIEVRKTTQNISVVRFNIAINNGKDEQGNPRPADFISCQAWKNNADFLGRYASKGAKVGIHGKLKNNNYTDKQGIKRYETYVLVESIDLGFEKKEERPSQAPQQGNNLDDTFRVDDINPDDLPFY